MTSNSTHIRCGEHSQPLFYAAGSVFCEQGCDLSWSDLRPEHGERITTRDIGEITHAAVFVEHAVDHGGLAQMIRTAAEMLGREEVMYALGLDHEHVQTVEYVEATLPDGSTRMVEVPRDEAEAVAEMDAAIADHAALVQALDDLARSLAEG